MLEERASSSTSNSRALLCFMRRDLRITQSGGPFLRCLRVSQRTSSVMKDVWKSGSDAERDGHSANAFQSGALDLVILAEMNYALSYRMLDPAKVVQSLRNKPDMVHVILTGRNAHPTIVELADTVTEMRQVKHAYEKGVLAQKGIEY